MNLCEFLEMLRGDVRDYIIWIPAYDVLIDLTEFLDYDFYKIRFKKVECISKNGNCIQITIENWLE